MAQVTAKCKKSHVGNPQVTVCSRPLTDYEVVGCEEKIMCVTPSKTEAGLAVEDGLATEN